jgi:uncharacterized membrane protein YphA (DoxX/SURF4 family)
VRTLRFDMKTPLYGRIVFGASAVLFGVIALMWHDADTWQNLSKIWSLPFGTIVGACLMIAQIWGGIALTYPRTARWASIVLGIVYTVFSLACLAAIVPAPRSYAQYGNFFEQSSLLCGAIAVYAATTSNAAQAARLGRAVRVGLGVCAVWFMLAQIIYFRVTASLVPTWFPPNQTFWAALTTVAFGLAAIAMLVNYQARLATRLMSLMLALFGVLVWIPILRAQPQAHGNWSEFAITLSIAGASWMVADLRTV